MRRINDPNGVVNTGPMDELPLLTAPVDETIEVMLHLYNLNDGLNYGANNEYFVYADATQNLGNLDVQIGGSQGSTYNFIVGPHAEVGTTNVPVQLRYTGKTWRTCLVGQPQV